jgi:hypothetical protein
MQATLHRRGYLLIKETEARLTYQRASDQAVVTVAKPPEPGKLKVRVVAHRDDDWQDVADHLALAGVELDNPRSGHLPKYPETQRAYGTLDLNTQPIDQVAQLQQRLHDAMEEIRNLKSQEQNLDIANDAEVKEPQATIARLQGRLAGLEGENERLKEAEAKARSECERIYAKLAKAPDAQEFDRMQQENTWAHQKFEQLHDLLQQSKKVRQDIHARADSAKKSPLAPGIHWLLDLVDNMARVLGE